MGNVVYSFSVVLLRVLIRCMDKPKRVLRSGDDQTKEVCQNRNNAKTFKTLSKRYDTKSGLRDDWIWISGSIM